MSGIHATAVVDPRAELGAVEIGPFAVIGEGVRLADGVQVGAHAVILGHTEVGARTRVGPHAVLGGDPQDHKHDGSATRLIIGPDNDIREFCTLHRGSSAGSGVTMVGAGNLLMVGAHVAHDCRVGDRVTFANGVALAGHSEVGDRATLGGMAGLHQFARVGRLAMLGAGAMCAQDVPPFSLVWGDRARVHGLNTVGLERAGMADAIPRLTWVFSRLWSDGRPTPLGIAEVLAEEGQDPLVAELLAFAQASQRGLCRWA